MKYVLELLGGSGSTEIYNSRAAAISALDSYPSHRPGQPIAVVYMSQGRRKALLAIGHDAGVGVSGDYKRYTIIGDCDCTGHDVTTTVMAKDVLLDPIDYENLLNEMEELYGARRFGYLGTNSDPWKDTCVIPKYTSVQAAFEAILCGKSEPDPGQDRLVLAINVSPNAIEVSEQAQMYTVTVIANYTGTLTSATFTTNGQNPLNILEDLRDGQWSATYIVGYDYPIAPDETQTINYSVTATVGNITQVSNIPITIHRPKEEPQPTQDTYTIHYMPNGASGQEVTKVYHNIPALVTDISSFGWEPQPLYGLDGWAKSSGGEKLNTLVQSDFIEVEEHEYVLDLYALWVKVGVNQLRVITNPQYATWNKEEQIYDVNTIYVIDTTGAIVDPAEYTLEWTPADGIPKGTNVGTYNGSVKAIPFDLENYEPSDDTRVTLIINAKPATVIPMFALDGEQDWKTEDEIAIGHDTPEVKAMFSGFFSEDEELLPYNNDDYPNTLVWHPVINMNAANTYVLHYEADIEHFLGDLYVNYNITINTAQLTLIEPPMDLTFTTVGYDHEPLVKYEHLHDSGFFQAAGTNISGLSGNVEDWWFFESNRKEVQPTTVVDINRLYTMEDIEIVKWDSASNKWFIPNREIREEFSATQESGSTIIKLEYYDPDYEEWTKERALYGIKFNN